MNRLQPYATTILANGTRFQVLATLAISNGSGSAQGTPRDAAPRATMNGQCDSTGLLVYKGGGWLRFAGRRVTLRAT